MPKIAKELSALEVKRLAHPGTGGNVTYAVGGTSGLILQITPNGGRSWLLRTTISGRRRELGLGGYPDVSLAQARERAREAKDKIYRGIDPIAERKAIQAQLAASQRSSMTFYEAAEQCLASKLQAFRNAKHRDQWLSTINTYAIPHIGSMPLQDISVQDIVRVLNQPVGDAGDTLWQARTETASRLRGRIEAVLSWATVSGHRSGDNPARWAGNLKELLPPPSKLKANRNHPALQIKDAPRWFYEVRQREGMGSRALEFAALTAVRSREVRGATWDEFDLDAGLWVIPAARMKMDREHRVPLSDAALSILRDLPRFQDNPLTFPAARGGEMSDATLSATMKRIHAADLEAGREGFIDRVSKRPAVPHGLRSTFRDWIAETTQYPGEMAEIALAHKVGNAVEAAYRRGDMIEKRREMMADWASFLVSKKSA